MRWRSGCLVSSRLVSWGILIAVAAAGCDPASSDIGGDAWEEGDPLEARAGASASDSATDPDAQLTSTDDLDSPASMARAGVGDEDVDVASVSPGGGGVSCSGGTLPSCSGNLTGPSCAYPCDAGSACSFRYYCHGDDRIAGMAVARSRLFPLLPSASPSAAAAAFETWATQREVDLGFPDGLNTTLLQFAPANNAKLTQGALNLYRIRQFYRASSSLPSLPVVGEGSLLTLEASPSGVVAIKGTVIDPRRRYAFATSQATSAKAIASIRQHTSARLGVPIAEVTVNAPVRVAVPRVEQIGWYSVAYRGGELLARVTVSANPVPATLPVLHFSTGMLEALSATVPIEVRTQDPTSSAFGEPYIELDVDELADGTHLFGSVDDFSGDTQLADESVVLVDVQDGNVDNLLTGTLSRFTSATDLFLVGQPSDEFFAQRMYYLLRNAYAILNRVAVGKWDSALQHYGPSLTSGYAAGTFAPRMIALFGHESVGGAASHEAYGIKDVGDLALFLTEFPELVHRATVADTPEVVSTMRLPNPPVDVGILFHELGHGVDVFLGPGNARDHAPACQLGSVGCDETCDEDTTDEAWPLDETVAQMVSLWMVRRSFPELPHGQCDLLREYVSGGTTNRTSVHSPDCLDADDEINLWLRDDDPACSDDTLCDKPDRQASPMYGFPNNCRTTDGYNTFSILQVWWNTLNGKYCEPTAPFTCIDYAPQWPLGCGAGGGAPPCVTADEAAGLALIYALRTNPLSYVEFFDAMSRFVACNYGDEAYLVFNTSLCDHGIRCEAEPPLVCETCGNGIREGGEKCDGLDLTVDEVGFVPQCADFGYVDGDLACDAMCELDFSDCESPAADTSTSAGADETGDSDDAGSGAEDTGVTSAGDAGQVGEDGCSCTSGPSGGPGPSWLAFAVLGFRRRRFAAAFAVATSGCGPGNGSSDDEAALTTSAASESHGSSSSAPGGVDGWPERWYGQYYEATYVDFNGDQMEIELGVEIRSNYAGDYFHNVRLDPGVVQNDYFDSTGRQDRIGTSTLVPDVGINGLTILPDEGEGYIEWPPGPRARAGAEIRPGRDCSELELTMTFTSLEEPVVTTLRRGRLCLVRPVDPEFPPTPGPHYPNYSVVVDLCTDDPSPTACDPMQD